MITVDRAALLGPLSRGARIGDKSVIPVLNAGLFQAGPAGLSIVTNNMDIRLSEAIDTAYHDLWTFGVAANRLAGFIQALPSGAVVTFNDDGDTVVIASGRSRARLAAVPVADFPVFAGIEGVRLEVPAGALARALSFTLPCASTEGTRHYLAGSYLHADAGFVTVVATDGYRLGRCRVSSGPADLPAVIIPTLTVEHTIALLRSQPPDAVVTVTVGARDIEIEIGGAVLRSKIIDGTFPDYTRILPPRAGSPLVVPREPLLAAVKRLALIKENRGVRLAAGDGVLRLATSEAGAEITDDVACVGSAPLDPIGMQHRYLAMAVSAIDAAEVELHIRDPASPIWVCTAGEPIDGFIILPMRV